MPTKKAAVHPAAEFVAEEGNEEGLITPTQLATLVSRDPKTVRARLRKIAARDQSTLKGARWNIDVTLAAAEFDHYAALSAKEEEAS